MLTELERIADDLHQVAAIGVHRASVGYLERAQDALWKVIERLRAEDAAHEADTAKRAAEYEALGGLIPRRPEPPRAA